MIHGIVGEYNDYIENPMICGCGKTLTATYYLHQDKYLEYRNIYTNYFTSFSDDVLTTQEIIDLFLESKLTECSIGIDEIDKIFNSYGSSQKVIKFGEKLVSQGRKHGVDVYLTWQRFKDLHIRIRAFLEVILIPVKIHADYSECRNHRCSKEHYILVHSSKPFREKPIKKLVFEEVGKLYNTNQIIN